MRKLLLAWFACFAALFALPEYGFAQYSDFDASSSVEPKKKVRRTRKKNQRKRKKVPANSEMKQGASSEVEGSADTASGSGKSNFGAVLVAGYGMSFSDLEVDGKKQSMSMSGLDFSAHARYKLNLTSFSMPFDVGMGYLSRGYSTKDAGSGVVTDVTMSIMSLSLGTGLEFGFGASIVPLMFYLDYGLSNSTKAGSVSMDGVYASTYRLKLQTGYIYSLGTMKIGAVGGADMLSVTNKLTKESKSMMGAYGGAYLGAEF